MYNIKVNVNLTELGKKLMKRETYSTVMKFSDISFLNEYNSIKNSEGEIVFNNTLYDKFTTQEMPSEMFEKSSFRAKVIEFYFEDGEYVYMNINTNASTAIAIPMQVYFSNDDSNEEVRVRTIEKYNYDNIVAHLKNSAYTHTFDIKNLKLKFDVSTLKALNRSEKYNLNIRPMTEPEVISINDQIECAKLAENVFDKVEYLLDNTNIIYGSSKERLEDFLNALDMFIKGENYDEFGM